MNQLPYELKHNSMWTVGQGLKYVNSLSYSLSLIYPLSLFPDERIVPIYRERVSTAVRIEGLDNTWTVERCMEYLMLCGGATEAAWLAQSLGDWKTAVLIGVAVNKHKHMLPQLYQR